MTRLSPVIAALAATLLACVFPAEAAAQNSDAEISTGRVVAGPAPEMSRPDIAALSPEFAALPADARAKFEVSPAFAETLAEHGAVRVIVELAVALPEADGSAAMDELRFEAISDLRHAVISDHVPGLLGELERRETAGPGLSTGDEAESDLADGAVRPGDRLLHAYRVSPMFAAELTAAEIAALAGDPRVLRIHEDIASVTFLPRSTQMIRADDVWTAGETGSGVAVAILDNGFDVAHPFIASRVTVGGCYSTASTGYSSLCTTGTGPESARNCSAESCAHGTHVASTAAGGINYSAPNFNATFHSVAPNSSLWVIQVFVRAANGDLVSFGSDQLAALEALYTVRNNFSGQTLASINMSLGGGSNTSACTADFRRTIITTLRNAGIATVIATGNDGYVNAVSTPACIPEAIAVGSVGFDGVVASYSNHASLTDLLAPGGDFSDNSQCTDGIIAAVPNIETSIPQCRADQLEPKHGTSMASPHVAGAFALLRGAYPSATVSQLETALADSGVDTADTRPGGLGTVVPRIDVYAAFLALGGGGPANLVVTPSDTWQQTVERGSGLAVTRAYNLQNTGGESLTWTSSTSQPWLTIDGSTSGTIGAGSNTVIYARITENAFASDLPTGQHTATFTIDPSVGDDVVRNVQVTLNDDNAGPDNDDFADAIQITGTSATVTGSNFGATSETGEPKHGTSSAGNATVWWYWTAPSNGSTFFSTEGSGYDTTLAVYTGSAVNALSLIGGNDDYTGLGLRSRVDFTAVSGTTYRIAVAGYGSATGAIQLNLSHTPDTVNYALTVSRSGTGSGSVSSSPAGINCGSTCSASYASGTNVTLTATPDASSTFAGWSGACTGTGSCQVSMTQARSVTAGFALASRTLTVTRSGTGTGSVSSSPAGIDCGSTCSAGFDHGTSVTLTAAAGANTNFTGWSGACTGTGSCVVSMTQARDVTATFDLVGRALSVALTGAGTGSVASAPGGIACTSAGGTCSAEFAHGTSVALTPTADAGSSFAGWTEGDCTGASGCQLTLSAARSATARFTLDTPPDGRIVAATLPGARSGYVGGPPLTVFMSVVSRATTPAQSCTLTAPGTPPFTLSYRRVEDTVVTGAENPLFDLNNGGVINFVVALSPTAVTDAGGYVFLPQIECQNASLVPPDGVSSARVSIGAAPVPDILSIGATPSADGVVRIPDSGNRINFMSAAAVNIGAGDGSAGAGQATVDVSVDTGSAALPVTLEVCETASGGGCITPRGVATMQTVFDANTAKFFAVFVRANGAEVIPFDPANARVFLRFADAGGVTRSVTSAAISAPAPADQTVDAIPAGRWSVLVRQGSGDWPVLGRASLYVFADGSALLDDGVTVTALTFERFAAAEDMAQFDVGDLPGTIAGNSMVLGDAFADQPGALWGVRDARSDRERGWDGVAGDYGSVRIAPDGSVSGTLEGCIVHGTPRRDPLAPGLLVADVTLTSCEASGRYTAVVDTPANDGPPAIVLGGASRGWRVTQ